MKFSALFLIMLTHTVIAHYNPTTNFARILLGNFPTAVKQLTHLNLLVKQLYVKCDNECGKKTKNNTYFGGNKIRKLEFLLADALKLKKTKVLTAGCMGSNHVVATGSSCTQYGLECHAILCPQPDSSVVQRNLKLMHHYGITLHIVGSSHERKTKQDEILENDLNEEFYAIPVGGSCPIGILGFINAAFELKKQIENHEMPEPDVIYVPIGSCGTIVGLLLGIKLADLKTRVIAVAVEPEEEPGYFKTKIKELFIQTNQLLLEHDIEYQSQTLYDDEIIVNHKHTGQVYGEWTQEACFAIDLLKNSANTTLDGTYSAKACAALIADATAGLLKDKTVLFWNTFYGDDL